MKHLGYLGSFLAVACSMPQVLLVIKQGHGKGMDPSWLSMWFISMFILCFYVYKTSKDKALIAQYAIAGCQAGILLYYTIR